MAGYLLSRRSQTLAGYVPSASQLLWRAPQGAALLAWGSVVSRAAQTVRHATPQRGCEAGGSLRQETNDSSPPLSSCWASPSPQGTAQVDGRPSPLSEKYFATCIQVLIRNRHFKS